MENNTIEKKYNKWIVTLSILIPVAVAVLFKIKLKDLGFNVSPLPILPPIYATINGITAILLITAVLAIKKGNKQLHQKLMKIAIACSLVFLVLYIAYHMTTDSTKFGGSGAIKYVYYFVLLSHIIFPIWLYVAVTGVIVYLMIAPYYVQ